MYDKKQDTYCLRCKQRPDNKLITVKQVVNKLIAQKSSCVDCDSKKSAFVKKYKPDKKTNIIFTDYKTCKFIEKPVKNTDNTFPKKLVLISKNKIKGKSKCAICLTERTFIHEFEDKYDLESELEVYLQFFTDWCPFTRNKEIIENFMQSGNTDFICRNEVDKACFQHDIACGKSKDLAKRTCLKRMSLNQIRKINRF